MGWKYRGGSGEEGIEGVECCERAGYGPVSFSGGVVNLGSLTNVCIVCPTVSTRKKLESREQSRGCSPECKRLESTLLLKSETVDDGSTDLGMSMEIKRPFLRPIRKLKSYQDQKSVLPASRCIIHFS